MKNNIYLLKPFKEKKLIGRKRKSNEGLVEHNKFSDDNLIRKVKNIVLENIFLFINNKILSIYSTDERNNQNDLKKKQLLKLSQKQIKKSKKRMLNIINHFWIEHYNRFFGKYKCKI